MARKRKLASLALVSSMVLSSAGVLGQSGLLSEKVQAWNDAADENITEDIILDEETDFDTTDVDTDAASVKINATNFPDSVFRTYVKTFDKDKNNVLSSAEISAVTAMTITDK